MVRTHNKKSTINTSKNAFFSSNKLVNISIVFMGIVLFVFVLKTFVAFLRPLFFAVLLAVLFAPLINYFKKYKIPTYVTLFVTLIVFFTILYFLMSLVVFEAQQIIIDLPTYQLKLNNLIDVLTSNFSHIGAEIKISDVLNFQSLNKVISPILLATKDILSEILLITIFLIFIVPFYNSLDTKLIDLLASEKKEKFKKSILKTENSIRNYLFTKTMVSLGTGICSALLIYFFGSNFAISLSIIIFLFNFIPNIGSIIAVLIISILLVFELGLTLPFFILLGLLISIQFFFGNILEPLLEGKALKLSPLVIIISLFFWYWVWGIGGMILAIPLTSILKIVFEQFPSTEKYALFMSS